jgi:hypothetical protein
MASQDPNESEQPISEEALDTAQASEPSLSKDWLLPEEGEAWKSL